MPGKKSIPEKTFDTFNIIILLLIAFTCVYPFIYILSMSLSTAAEASREGFHLYPKEISFTAYKMVLSNPDIVRGFFNSVLRTVLGTTLSVIATCIAAYPLARKEMPMRSNFIFFIMFTMLFSGGMVPTYLLIKNLGLFNSVWALVLPPMLTAFSIIIVKNFFQSLPESFAEAARMEGASEWHILFKIYIPLSKPVLATVALWSMVGHWNSWFDAMLYITDDKKQVLQIFLQRVVIESNTALMEMGITDATVADFTPETIKAATVIITILPIICVYPFLQKYFSKGIMLGGIKE
jgi:ABC-type glycerol-3-phosphate transport system permease component